jgi:hypothetical protein
MLSLSQKKPQSFSECGLLHVWKTFGGAEEDRTPDLCIANAALSQLSYRPTSVAHFSTVFAFCTFFCVWPCKARHWDFVPISGTEPAAKFLLIALRVHPALNTVSAAKPSLKALRSLHLLMPTRQGLPRWAKA